MLSALLYPFQPIEEKHVEMKVYLLLAFLLVPYLHLSKV